jgi:hypothetical protein
MVPTFRSRHFRLENGVRARTLFPRTQGLSAAARSISQAVLEAAVRLPAPANVTNLQRYREWIEARVRMTRSPARTDR